MGKGGEQSQEVKVAHSATFLKKKARLNAMETEQLRKWATAYGVKCADDRETLLEELVS